MIFSNYNRPSIYTKKITKKIKRSYLTQASVMAAFAIAMMLSPTVHAMYWNDTLKALQVAVSLGQLEKVKQIMQNVPEQEAKQYLPQIFCSAVHHKEFEMVKFMLEKGADPNMIAGKDGSRFTILMHAAVSSHPSIVNLLTTYGADVLARDANGYSALNYCQSNPDSDYASRSAIILEEKMRELGCNTLEPLNATLLEATKNRKQDVSEFIEQILRLGADPNTKDKHGNTVLDLSLQQLTGLNRNNANSLIIEKIKTLYTYGADTSTYKLSDYLTPQEITELEEKRYAKLLRPIDELYLQRKHALDADLLALPFEKHREYRNSQELSEHTPLPETLTQLVHEHLFNPHEHLFNPANFRKRKCAETNANRYVKENRELSTKSRKLNEEEKEKEEDEEGEEKKC